MKCVAVIFLELCTDLSPIYEDRSWCEPGRKPSVIILCQIGSV